MSTRVSAPRLAFRAYGDAALLVDVVGGSYEDRWSTTQALGRALRGDGPQGYVDAVASYQNVVVFFDPLLTDRKSVV